MLIAHIEFPSRLRQGDQVYRTYQPCEALAAECGAHVVAGTWLSPVMQRLAWQADVLVLCQTATADLLPVVAHRRARGLTTVFEINDNFLDLQPWNPSRWFYEEELNRALVFQLAHLCHGLQLSSDALAQRFGMLQPAHAVFPNQRRAKAEPIEWRKGPVCIGWAGSGGHRDDIAWAVPTLRKVLELRPHVHAAFMLEKRAHEVFASLPQERVSLHLPGSLETYHRFLQKVDIGIAPLLDTPFNRCRSDVKYLEYAAHGVAMVAQDLDPYRQCIRPQHNGLLFTQPHELQQSLLHLIDNACARRGQALRAWLDVNTYRQEAAHAPRRLDFYKRLGARSDHPADHARKRVDAAFTTHPTSAEQPHERFWQLQLGDMERCLLDHAEGESSDMMHLAQLQEATRRYPAAYLPAMQLGMASPDPSQGRYNLDLALHRNPSSNLAAFALGALHLKARDLAAATLAFTEAVTIAPTFAQGYETLARLAAGRNDTAAADTLLVCALQANPYYRRPALTLAQLRGRQRDWAGVQACLQAPAMPVGGGPSPRHAVLLAQACQQAGNAQGAARALQDAIQRYPNDTTLHASLARLRHPAPQAHDRVPQT